MTNLIRGEFYKLRKSKYFIGMILLAVVAGFILMIQWDHELEMKSTYGYHDIIDGMFAIVYSFYFIVEGSLLFVLLGVEFIIKDFKNRNISKSFTYGYTRNQVMLSKLLVFMIFSLVLEMIYGVILVIYVSLNHGFCEAMNLSNILYLTRVIGIGIIFSLATISIIVMISVLTKNIIFTCASFVILMLTVPLSFSGIGSYIFPYMPYLAGFRAIDRFTNERQILVTIISSVLTLVITIGTSLLYVKNEDIK